MQAEAPIAIIHIPIAAEGALRVSLHAVSPEKTIELLPWLGVNLESPSVSKHRHVGMYVYRPWSRLRSKLNAETNFASWSKFLLRLTLVFASMSVIIEVDLF